MHSFAGLAGERGVECGDDVVLDVKLTHNDIASLVGSTRETVSLEMSQLARAGRIRVDGRAIAIPKKELAAL